MPGILFVICQTRDIMIQKKTVKNIFAFPRKTSLVFFLLLALSVGFYVSADEQGGKAYSLFQDADQDGLSDEEERVFGTDPLAKDTDGDSYSDGIEVESGYDPLKPAPGDKLVSSDDGLGKGGYEEVSADDDSANVTEQASQGVANILASVSEENPSVKREDINASVEQLLEQSVVNVEIPEVDIKTLRIKEVRCKDSDGEEKCLKKQQDATIEYLTMLSYLVANNSPVTLKNNGDLDLAASSLVSDIMSAFSTGNFSLILKNKSKAEAFLNNVREIEVPENMVATHVKALQLALFSVGLAEAFGKIDDDPIAQISLLSQVQGLLGFATGLPSDLQAEFEKLGIDLIPVDL